MTRAEYDAKYGSNKPAPTPTGIDRVLAPATKVARGILSFTGGNNVAESIGTLGGYLATKGKDIVKGTDVASKYDVSAPSPLATAGDAGQLGLTMLPVGKIAAGATKIATTAGLKGLAARGAGEAMTAVGAGYGYDVATNLKEGKTGAEVAKPGLGAALGAALPVAGAVATGARSAAQSLAPKLINSLIKPLSKQFTYGKDPGRTVAELGITGNNFDELATNIRTARTSVAERLQTEATQVSLREPLHLSPALEPFDNAIKSAVENNDQALLNRLMEAKKALTGIFKLEKGLVKQTGTRLVDNLDYAQGLEFKRRIGNLTKWTGQKTEDDTVNGALTRAYAFAKEAMDEAAENSSPEKAAMLKKLNQQYADLTSAEIATKYRDVIEKRHNMINLPGKLGLVGAAVSAPFTGGLSTLAMAAGSIAADKALSSPGFKTRAAKYLARIGKTDGLVSNLPGLTKAVSPGDKFLESPTGKAIAKYISEVQPGLSMKNVSPAAIAKNVDTTDVQLINNFLANPKDPNAFMAIQPMIEAIGINKAPDKLQTRFLQEVIDELRGTASRPILPVKKK